MIGRPELPLDGKVAVVTGASSGIGAAAAIALADAGMTVVATARREDRLAEVAARHPAIRTHPLDVGDPGSVAELAAWVDRDLGSCAVLVNNAGINRGHRFRGPEDIADINAVLDTNFLGAVRCLGAFADLLERSAPSRVINVGSVAGKIGIGAAGYAASKFALVGFTEALRAPWGARGVALCQLNPGFIRTEGFPQTALVRNGLTRRLVAGPEVVAEAIVDVARSGAAERTVPRWYRSFVVLRHVVPGLFWPLARRAA